MSIYKVTAHYPDGSVHSAQSDDWDFYSLTRALDKCEILSFTVSLATYGEPDTPHSFENNLINNVMNKSDNEPSLFDAGEVRKYLRQEQWVIDIAKKDHIQWSDIEDVVENFILKYWLIEREEITSQHVGEILRIAKDFQP